MPKRWRKGLTRRRQQRRGWHSRPRWIEGWRPSRPRPGAERRRSARSVWPRRGRGQTRPQGVPWRSCQPGSWRRARCPSLTCSLSTRALEGEEGAGGSISTACGDAADEGKHPGDTAPLLASQGCARAAGHAHSWCEPDSCESSRGWPGEALVVGTRRARSCNARGGSRCRRPAYCANVLSPCIRASSRTRCAGSPRERGCCGRVTDQNLSAGASRAPRQFERGVPRGDERGGSRGCVCLRLLVSMVLLCVSVAVGVAKFVWDDRSRALHTNTRQSVARGIGSPRFASQRAPFPTLSRAGRKTSAVSFVRSSANAMRSLQCFRKPPLCRTSASRAKTSNGQG